MEVVEVLRDPTIKKTHSRLFSAQVFIRHRRLLTGGSREQKTFSSSTKTRKHAIQVHSGLLICESSGWIKIRLLASCKYLICGKPQEVGWGAWHRTKCSKELEEAETWMKSASKHFALVLSDIYPLESWQFLRVSDEAQHGMFTAR